MSRTDNTNEEFARMWEYLISVIPSHSVDGRSAPQKNEKRQIGSETGSAATTIGGPKWGPIEIGTKINKNKVHDVHPGLKPAGPGSQVWED